MPIVKDIIIKGDSSDAVKSIDDVTKASKNLSKSVDKTNEDIEKTGKTSKKSSSMAAKGFRAMGTALKAMGIGLVIAAIAGLANALSKNQKFMDAFNTVAGAIGIVFTEVANVLVDVYENVSKSSENFNALGKVLGGLLTLAITPLKVGFFGIKLAIQEAQLIWEKSFFGGKDAKTIAELNVGILETKNSLLEVAKGALDAGKDIVTNFGEAITEASNITSAVVEGVSKISIKAALETAKANTQIENSARLAAAQQGRLVEQFDRAAELQRQARDNESKSIAERTIANDALLVVLEKQEKAMLAQAELQIADANAKDKVNSTIETQIALTEALANKEAILAQITGFRSEQDVNRIALKKEEIELNQTISDSEKARQLLQLDFEVSQEENAILKLEKQRERLDEENQIIIDDLERKRGLFAEGTQARVDAEQDFLNKKQVIDNALIANVEEKSKKEIEIEKTVEQAKASIREAGLNNISAGISLIASLGKKSKALQASALVAENAVGIAKTLISTAAAPAVIGLKYAAVPAPLGPALIAKEIAMGKISAGISIASSIAATAKGLSALGGGSAGGGGSIKSGGGGVSAPSFNLVEGSGSNQIAQGLSSQQQPIRAVVISGDMTTAQSVDRNIVSNSTI